MKPDYAIAAFLLATVLACLLSGCACGRIGAPGNAPGWKTPAWEVTP